MFRGSEGVGIVSPPIGFSVIYVRMNARKPAVVYAWGQDLEASRDVNERQRDAFGMVLGWLENWRMRTGIEPGRESCIRFWREQVMAKEREPWQLEQWSGAILWYLRWLKYRRESGGEVRSLEERDCEEASRASGFLHVRAAQGSGRGDDRQTGDESRVPACFCHPSAGRRQGSADDPGTTRTRGCEDDGNLHACGERSGGAGGTESAGCDGSGTSVEGMKNRRVLSRAKSRGGYWEDDLRGRNRPGLEPDWINCS
jgi:hypothetical protein